MKLNKWEYTAQVQQDIDVTLLGSYLYTSWELTYKHMN